MPDRDGPDREAEIRRRYDADDLIGSLGELGERLVAVAERAGKLTAEECAALVDAYEELRGEALASGSWPALEEAWSCSRPYPEHAGNLYAIDARARAAFNYAGLVARERAAACGSPSIVPVERTAEGAVMALAMELAGRRAAFAPFDEETVALLRRPWDLVVGER